MKFEKYNIFNYMSTAEEQKELKKYFFDKYPTKVNILNNQGFINPITLDIVLKFAVRKKDIELINMVQKLKDKFEEIDTKKDADKYNI